MRLPLPIVASLSALALAAGCGGAEAEPASLATADAVPASAAVYVSVQTDLDSDQWQQVDELVKRFHEGEQGVRALLARGLSDEDVDFERDVDPAFGPTVEVVWLGAAEAAEDGPHTFGAPDEDVVALTRPDDVEKLRELASKGDEPLVVGEVEGWSALAKSEATLDRFRAELAKGALADDADFREAVADLPDDPLATVYADGERVQDALGGTGGWTNYPPLADASGAVAALEASDDGVRVTARAEGVDAGEGGEGLIGEVPSGAFFALNLGGRTGPTAASGLGSLEERAGIPLSRLAEVLEGDAVLYARPAPLIPEITLLAAPSDPEAAKTQLDEALSSTPILGGAERRQTSIDGTVATVVDLGRLAIVYAVVGERLVVSTLPGAVSAVKEGGDRLVDDDGFEDALEAAGVEDGETVVAYADLREAVKLLEGLSALDGGALPPDAARNLEPLRSLVAATGSDDDATTFRFFVGVE